MLNLLTERQLSWDNAAEWVPPIAPVLFLWLALSMRFALYRVPNEIRPATIASWTGENTFAICAVTVLATFFSRQFGAGVSRMFVCWLAPITFAVLATTRCIGLGLVALLQRRWQTPRIALVGDMTQAKLLVSRLESRIVKAIRGVIVSETSSEISAAGSTLPTLGTTEQIAELVNREQIDHAIIMNRSLPDSTVEHCRKAFWRMGVSVSYALDLPCELKWAGDGLRLRPRLEMSERYGLPTVEFRRILFTRTQDVSKRAFDFALSSLLIVLLGPAMAVAALIVKLTSRGPVLERTLRIGKGGRHFNCLKFRTTYVNQPTRSTRIGFFLTRYRIDELPQLANILRGKMSFIGPAPLPVDALETGTLRQEDAARFETRSRVQPGLTGLWQVSHTTLSFDEMVQLDLEYVRHQSLSLDLSILLATPIPVLRGTRLPTYPRSVLHSVVDA